MDELYPILKKVLIGVAVVILIIILGLIIHNNVKKNEKKETQPTKVVTKEEEPKPDTQKQEVEDKDVIIEPEEPVVVPPEEEVIPITQTIRCSYEGTDYNVVWERSYVNFGISPEGKVTLREDVREYKFEEVNIDEYINNKTLDRISKTLDSVGGITSKLTPIDEADHTYRFETLFNFDEIDLDELYNKYYKIFYTGDIEMSKEEFYERYKSLTFEDMSKAYIGVGYKCENN